MLKIKFDRDFYSSYAEFSEKHNNLLLEVDRRIKWFKKNPNDTRLKNHALKKRMKGKFAFWITNDIRIVYEYMGKTTVRFLAIGGHRTVYSKK